MSEPILENPSTPMVLDTKTSEETRCDEETTEVTPMVMEERLVDAPDWAKALVEAVNVHIKALGKHVEEVGDQVGKISEKVDSISIGEGYAKEKR